jgi:hypothetical protein
MVIALLAAPYIVSPVYKFAKPEPFSGKYYCNPYQQMDSSWIIANFHSHSREWCGFTNGNAVCDSVIQVYRQIGYSHIGISNYQKITHVRQQDGIASIPVYEHGYNISKRHHLCLGAKKVVWTDFILFQTLTHKQYMLNVLRNTTDFLAINHPKFSNGYEESDFSSLSNYDAIEVLNHYVTSIHHWDSALSAGYRAVLLADDDMHHLYDMDETGTNFTVVNTGSIERHDIINALKAGRHYGVKVKLGPDESWQVKRERNAALSHPKIIDMQGDTLTVQFNKKVAAIRLKGQNGKMKKSFVDTDSAKYVFETADTYIRIEMEDSEGNLYLFNPVVRTDEPQQIKNPLKYTVNIWLTAIKYTATAILLLLIFVLYRRTKKRKK